MKTARSMTFRLDRASGKYRITPEGYLVCDAFATRAGVFDYHDDDGNIVRELRPPEEVFDAASLATLAMQPVTFLHPDAKKVTAENIRGLQVGVTGENIARDDGDLVRVRVKITDKAVVAYILDRYDRGESVELSCGYDASLEETPGEHPTEGHYDAVQRNIRYNHVAIVGRGRAGAQVKLKLDQKEAFPMFTFIRKAVKIDGFSMDAIDDQAPEEAQGILSRLSAKLDEAIEVIKNQAARIAAMTTRADQDQARIDTLDAENKKLKADLEAFSDPCGEKIQAVIADRRAIEDVAGRLEIKTDGLDNKALKMAVIQKQAPDFSADGRSDDYIDARFDAVVEIMKAARKDGSQNGLSRFIADAAQAGAQGHVDHQAEFAKQSAALFDGAK